MSENKEPLSLEELHVLGDEIISGISEEDINPQSIDLIWNLEPKELTTQHRAVIIQNLRQNRHKYEEKRAQVKEKKLNKKTPKPDVDLSKLTLDDLDI
jgi:hypothetical protein